MRVLVCGSRDFEDDLTIFALLDGVEENFGITHVHHGGANGADKIAGEWANKRGVSVTVHHANWKELGKSAGFKRNIAMLNQDPDLVIAFWDGESRGTEHTITEAEARGISTLVWTKPWIKVGFEIDK